MSGPAAPLLPVLKELYDVENDRDCRRVRERITELDLVVGRVVPRGVNSGNNNIRVRGEEEDRADVCGIANRATTDRGQR